MQRADLHLHTTVSDGVLEPLALVKACSALGLAAIAITDHDVTDGVEEAVAAGLKHGVEVIAGVEINTDHGPTEIHILGYGLNLADPGFQKTMTWLREGRVSRAREMVGLLRRLGAPVSWERVQEISGRGAIGRPHLAEALIEEGHVPSRAEAFIRYLGNDGPAYVPRERFNAVEAIATIRGAGGVAVVAHPVKIGDDTLIPALVESGLGGIEAYHPDHSDEDAARYCRMADQLGVVWTGGSDFHGNNESRPLACRTVPYSQVEALLAETQRFRAELNH
ncbi:MAG TPA: PHP domain-containing protein [Armatimonadota bacterium]|jgi:hypothetical protein